jgi:hypothetical protein
LRRSRVADPQVTDQSRNHSAHSEFCRLYRGASGIALVTTKIEIGRELDFLFVTSAAFLVEFLLTRERVLPGGLPPPNLG